MTTQRTDKRACVARLDIGRKIIIIEKKVTGRLML